MKYLSAQTSDGRSGGLLGDSEIRVDSYTTAAGVLIWNMVRFLRDRQLFLSELHRVRDVIVIARSVSEIICISLSVHVYCV